MVPPNDLWRERSLDRGIKVKSERTAAEAVRVLGRFSKNEVHEMVGRAVTRRTARLAAAVAMFVFAAGAVSPIAHGGALMDAGDARKASARLVTLQAVSEADEGDSLTLTARMKSARSAGRIALEKYRPPFYDGDPGDWEPVDERRVRGRSQIAFDVVAVDLNEEKYRAVVSYGEGRIVTSKAVTVTVWRWIPLAEYDPYYEAEPYAAGPGTTQINGQSYSGWGPRTYSHTGSWESRFTPGRNCKAFRTVLGLADISSDGSSGLIRFLADDSTVYESPVLTPGRQLEATVPLDLPYRFGLQILDTSEGGTTGRDDVESWPVLGEPAFNCTGV